MNIKKFNGLKCHKKSDFLFAFIDGELHQYNYGSEGKRNKWIKSDFTNCFDAQKYWRTVDEGMLIKMNKSNSSHLKLYQAMHERINNE
jgi:hypothetical protein